MKKVVIGVTALMMAASVASASPVDLKKGEFTAGYTYNKTDLSLSAGGKTGSTNTNTNGFFIYTALDDKFKLGVEYSKWSLSGSAGTIAVTIDTKVTDVVLQYAVDKNVGLIAGNRKYSISGTATVDGDEYTASGSENKFLYGIMGKANMGKNIDGYAALLKTSYETEWRVGAIYSFDKNTYLDVNYKHHKYDLGGDVDFTAKGFGLNFGFKF